MGDYLTMNVHGLKEMGDRLADLPGKIAREALVLSVREGALIVRDRARGLAPLGTKTYKDWKGRIHRPGFLRKTTERNTGIITRKLRTKSWWNTALFGVGFSKRGYYGKFIEYGKKKKHHYAPHPFVEPAMNEKFTDVVNAIKGKLGAELRRIVLGYPGMNLK